MPKMIEDDESLQYKKQLAELMAELNPKPTLEVIEKLKRLYMEKRQTNGTS